MCCWLLIRTAGQWDHVRETMYTHRVKMKRSVRRQKLCFGTFVHERGKTTGTRGEGTSGANRKSLLLQGRVRVRTVNATTVSTTVCLALQVCMVHGCPAVCEQSGRVNRGKTKLTGGTVHPRTCIYKVFVCKLRPLLLFQAQYFFSILFPPTAVSFKKERRMVWLGSGATTRSRLTPN